MRTVVGLSNLTSGRAASDRDRKRAAELAFLPMLAAAGVTMVMLNVFHTEAVRLARACESLLSPKVFAWETLSRPYVRRASQDRCTSCLLVSWISRRVVHEDPFFGRIRELPAGDSNKDDRRSERR